MTPREIEKLQAIGYENDGGFISLTHADFHDMRDGRTVEDGWAFAKQHAQSSGLKVTMADKVRRLHAATGRYVILSQIGSEFFAEDALTHPWKNHGVGKGDSPEAAVDALFWAAP